MYYAASPFHSGDETYDNTLLREVQEAGKADGHCGKTNSEETIGIVYPGRYSGELVGEIQDEHDQ